VISIGNRCNCSSVLCTNIWKGTALLLSQISRKRRDRQGLTLTSGRGLWSSDNHFSPISF